MTEETNQRPDVDPVLPCIVCGKTLERVFDEQTHNQPYRATSFQASGQYGSTAFDPQDDTYLEVNVCDDCLRAGGASGQVLLCKGIRELERWKDERKSGVPAGRPRMRGEGEL